MPRTPTFDEPILNLLKEGSLTGKELKERLEVIGDSKRKSFNESLIRLVEKNKIRIEGYDPTADERDRKQAFIPDPLIFNIIRRVPSVIRSLYKQMESSDIMEAEYATDELKNLFRGKIREIENKRLADVYIRNPNDEEILYYHAIQVINEDKDEKIHEWLMFDHQSVIGDVMNLYREKISEFKDNYPELKIYLFKGSIIENEPYEPLPSSITEEHLFVDGDIEKEEFLQQTFNIKRVKMTNSEVDQLFDKIVNWIGSLEEGKNKFMECFVAALSGMEGSEKKLDSLVHNVSGEHLILSF